MTVIQLIRNNKALVKAFERFQKRYLRVGKKPDVKKLLPDDLYSTMRLEGETITKKEARELYK